MLSRTKARTFSWIQSITEKNAFYLPEISLDLVVCNNASIILNDDMRTYNRSEPQWPSPESSVS